MNLKNVGIALLIIGVVILLVALLADVAGIGASEDEFGWRQIVGVLVGLAVAVVGAVLIWRAGQLPSGDQPAPGDQPDDQ